MVELSINGMNWKYEPSPLVADFFILFSRLEYALKKSGLIQCGKAKASLNKFAKKLPDDFWKTFQDKEIIKNSPRNQILKNGSVEFEPDGRKVNNNKELLGAVRTVRNNLFHGGKYPNGEIKEAARNDELINNCIEVIKLALAKEKTKEIANIFMEQN